MERGTEVGGMSEDEAYERLCANCPLEGWCHDRCEVCEEYMEAVEE